MATKGGFGLEEEIQTHRTRQLSVESLRLEEASLHLFEILVILLFGQWALKVLHSHFGQEQIPQFSLGDFLLLNAAVSLQ